jgi:hypothetical protein
MVAAVGVGADAGAASASAATRTHLKTPLLLQTMPDAPDQPFRFAVYLDTLCHENSCLALSGHGFRT